ncbi:MAG TPA: tRNA pseudouridine(38-40) synthase TruA [Thermoanaerobaculia bacterium]|nr:tRNA pseudouridine(38-40) synthase TruA [Thermoanaerobaculia bacterium]
MRLRLDLAYLGTRFEGWQAQDVTRAGAAPRTVQGELERALAEVYGAATRVHGAGRTDAGVHADGQVAHFDEPEGGPSIPPRGLARALNGKLAEDVRVLEALEAPPEFHARFSAAGKVYVYRLRRGEVLHPHLGLVEALAKEPLDLAAMREAASTLTGTRDFAPFSLTGSPRSTTVRTLSRLDVEEDGSLLLFTLEADGFLRGMARRLVGTLREVGRGRTRPADAVRTPGPTAEARGLTLRRVLYPPERPCGSR